MKRVLSRMVSGLALAACTSSSRGDGRASDAQSARAVASAMQASIGQDLDALVAAATDLQAAAPTGHAWDPADADAIAKMRAAWGRARTAYEHVEGAVAPIFPDIDAAIDERYDGFLETLGAAGDPNAFDGDGVTGMHAVERILWSDAVPERVVTFETSLPGYRKAAFPATAAEAQAFKTELVGRLVADVTKLRDAWHASPIDVATAWGGLVSLVREQREKVSNAAEGAEESRYSQRTLDDIRDNLEGTRKIYGLFSSWITAKGGQGPDERVKSGFSRLAALYASYTGQAIPAPPPTWSAEAPSAADLATPFGKLYAGVTAEADVNVETSTVRAMEEGGALVGFGAAR